MNRFGEQVETVTTETLLDAWPRRLHTVTNERRTVLILVQILLPKQTERRQACGAEMV